MRSVIAISSAALAFGLGLAPPARADLPSKVFQETAEFVMKKFGTRVAAEGTEKLAGKLTSAVARHGDDVLAAVRRVGPKALGLADEAGENAPRMLRFLSRHGDDGLRVLSRPEGMKLFSRFGDDAAEVLIRHKGAAAPLLEQLGEPAIKALGAVSPQAGRRMAMLAGDLAASRQGPEIMGVIARYGDPAMEFIWKHKGILAGGAALAAFLANPEPYLDGTNRLVNTASVTMVKPAIEAAGAVAQQAVGFVSWTLTIMIVVVAVGLGWSAKSGLFDRPAVRAAAKVLGKRLESYFH